MTERKINEINKLAGANLTFLERVELRHIVTKLEKIGKNKKDIADAICDYLNDNKNKELILGKL